MIIESDQINIKDLLIDEPQVGKDSWFDPERDITSGIWQAMVEKLKESRGRSWEIGWVELARSMMIFSPEKSKSLITENQAWEYVKTRDSNFDMPGRAGPQFQATNSDIFTQAFSLRVLCPHKIGEVNKRWILLRNLVDRITRATGPDSEGNLQIRAAIKLLYPEQSGVGLSNGLKATVGIYLDRGRDNEDWNRFLELAALARLIEPEFIDSLDLTTEDRDGMKEYLSRTFKETKETNAWEFAARQAASLAIIAAPEIKITDDGLKLIWPEKEQIKEDESPEVRKF